MLYVVTSGEYSYYGIVGIFSSQGKAEVFIKEAKKQTNSNSDFRIEEWKLDEREKDTVATFWTAILDIATGDIEKRDPRAEFTPENERVKSVDVLDYVCEAHPKGHIISQSYVSSEHAVKLCVEKQQELLRKEE